MARLYLVRHGEVEFNRENAYIGRTDLPLNDMGLQQAKMIARYFKGKGVSRIYSSDLTRAVKTAEAVAELTGVTVTLVPALRELDYGEWEGIPEKIVAQQYPLTYSRWRDKPVEVSIPGGESVARLIDRIQPVFEEIADLARRENVLVVAHKCVNRVFLCLILDIDPNRYRQIGQQNGAINIIESREDGRLIVERINDTCHLNSPVTEDTLK